MLERLLGDEVGEMTGGVIGAKLTLSVLEQCLVDSRN